MIDFVDNGRGKHSKTGGGSLSPQHMPNGKMVELKKTGGAENAGGEPETKGAAAIAEYKYEKDEGQRDWVRRRGLN